MKSRHLIPVGVLFSALAFSGATYAQSSTTTPTTPGSSQSAASSTTSPSSTTSSMDSSSNRSASSNTATPAGSAASGTTDSHASSSAADRSQTSASGNDRTQASSSSADTSRAGTMANATAQPHAMRASKIIGANVENANGDNIGEIKDMVVDMQNEQVRYVVLSHGGILGIGDKLFAYPMSIVQPGNRDSDKIVMNVSKDKLEKAPGFDKNKWPDFADSKYTGEIDRYYGAESRTTIGDKPAHVVLASDLIGKDFDDRQGKDAGEVDDLIVDSSTGRVQYAVVDFDDSWNKDADGKLVAIPLSDLAMSGDKGDKLVIQTTRDRIDLSHAFTKSQWPNFNDPAWNQQRRSPRS